MGKKTLSTDEVKEILEFKDGDWVTLIKVADLQDKTIKVTEKDYKGVVKPDEGFDGLSSVDIDVAVTVPLDFADIGYYDRDSVQADLAYSKAKYEAWSPTNISAARLYAFDEKLKYAPLIDTSRVSDMDYMFSGCSSLTMVPPIDTNNNGGMTSMFGGCSSLKELPLFVASHVDIVYHAFNNCSSLTTVGGFTNLGKAFTQNVPAAYRTLDLSSCPLSSDSVTNIANTVYDMNQNTVVKTATVKFKSTVYSALTDEQKTLFTNKRWAIASA